MDFIDLFAGIGGLRLPFDERGAKCVFSSEIDKHARATYGANFGEEPAGDIFSIDWSTIPKFDLLLAGFPCQPFSVAGKQEGLFDANSGNAFSAVLGIAEMHRPEMMLLENVPGLLTNNRGKDIRTIIKSLNDLGYAAPIIKVSPDDYGYLQKRPRVFIFCGRCPSMDFWWHTFNITNRFIVAEKSIEDILEPYVDAKHYPSARAMHAFLRRNEESSWGDRHQLVEPEDDSLPCITASYRSNPSVLVHMGGGDYRKLTPRECANAQGYPSTFVLPCSDEQSYKQIGNSVHIGVVRTLADQIVRRYRYFKNIYRG